MSRTRGRERLLHAALAYGLLAVSAVAAAVMGDPPAGSNALAAAAPWLVAPWPVLAVAAALAAGNPAFVVFASLGHPLAVALLPTRLVMAGVTLTAVVVVAAQAGPGAPAGLFAVAGGIAVALVLAGWYVSAESDKRRRLIGELRTAMAENADLHARLLDQARRAGVLDERHRVAGEIHDTVAQDLAALIGQLGAADREAPRRARPHGRVVGPDRGRTPRRRGDRHPGGPGRRRRGHAVPHRPGSAGQRRQARRCHQDGPDSVVHGRSRHARHP
ncbi:hypothetical protein DMB42_23680 [Nonomuraea sp. WAC 01424]|uniref:histidine kinase n=1 Tax=Nonomuraea sp. WAC 01424 TaxID=2203200 RepID=UPI000F7996E9|nr:histidine kinase [Nonomuraea sp. WAC 01424]RSN07630.1 hypothetical protein DMB42_23680 [Nonomuraea sp. WAC 01424]